MIKILDKNIISCLHSISVDQCIEKLVKFDPSTIQRQTSYDMPNNNNNDSDDDADVLIESEEIQNPTGADKPSTSSSSNTQNEEKVKRVQWPSYQSNFGFSSTSAPLHPRNGLSSMTKQPRLMSSAIDKHPDVPDTIKHIEQNHRILICMRGAPGSGKSYLARSIIDRTMHGDYDNHIFSTDDFFYDRRSKRYCFDRNKLGQAHDTNQHRVSQRAINGWYVFFESIKFIFIFNSFLF